jgi:GTP-dependent dephospho-CoA kinase
MREELKAPLGELLRGEPYETAAKLREKLSVKPPLFAIVGDFVAANLIAFGMSPDIVVVDNKTLRVEVKRVEHGLKEIFVPNDAATINAEAWLVLRGAVTLKRRVAVVVEGEEDLLVLPLLAEMPIGSVIAYGQPHEGLVVVTVSDERREWARGFLNRMEMK